MNSQFAAVDREAIWAALFAWLKQQLGSQFKSMGRKHVMPPDLTTANQPALFQIATRETHLPKVPPGTVPQLLLQGILILYLIDESPIEDIGAEENLGETQLNTFLKLIDGAFVPDDPNGKFTLGGLVTHCWIEGDSDMDPGIFGPQCAAILPVRILID